MAEPVTAPPASSELVTYEGREPCSWVHHGVSAYFVGSHYLMASRTTPIRRSREVADLRRIP